ncbi:MAG: FadR/GntR family transcriptional regulator [Alphaproteobacteria bacterium]
MESDAVERAVKMPTATSVRVPKIAEIVADHIRRQIVRGELREGDTLAPESDFMKAFGVSRPTLREALRVLESENLIRVTRGSRGGARVQTPDVRVAARYAGFILQVKRVPLKDVFEAQRGVQLPAVRMLAERGRAADIETLRARLEAEKLVIGESRAFGVAVARFYLALVEVAGNEALSLMAHMLHDIVEMHFSAATDQKYFSGPALKMRELSIRSHGRLLDIVEVGEADKAVAHWRHHLDRAGEIIAKSIGSRTVVDLFD